MSRRRDLVEDRRRRVAAALRLLAGLSWLVLAVLVFRGPLAVTLESLSPSLGLDRFFRRPAPGFVIRVTSDPPGGRIWVDGADRGTVPLLSNVVCEEGETVRLQVVKDGFPAWEREVECREGRTLYVRARLRR